MNNPIHLSIKGLAAKAVSLLIALALLAAAVPQPVLAAPAAQTCAKSYTVVSGDTLSAIADKNGTTLAALATLNNLKEPYTLTVGQVLCLPATATTTTTTDAESTAASSGPDFSIEWEGNQIQISTTGFPTKSTFYVKVSEDKYKITKWTKVGRLHTKKTGAVEAIFRLPKGFRNVNTLNICIKNASSDAVLCKYFTR